MNTVSVIPHEQEILCRRLEMCNTVNDLVAVDYTVGIGVFGHAPHTLYGGILYDLFYHAHIRAVIVHRNRYEFHSKRLSDFEMAIITGRRTKPLYLVKLGPWLFRMQQTVCIRLCYGVVHQLKAGVAGCENLLGLYSQNISKIFPAYGQAIEPAVIQGIYAICNSVGYDIDIKNII